MKTNFLSPFLSLLVLCAILASSSFAQNNEAAPTLDEQFTNMITKSNRWEDFRVVKIKTLENFKANITDSLIKAKEDFAAKDEEIARQKEMINLLEVQLKNSHQMLEEISADKESITFLGFQIYKSTYKNIMWVLTGALSVLLLFFVYRFKRSNSVTQQIKNTLQEIQEEYNNYKKRAMEKEQRLARELQTELNKKLV
jgi:septal ring factor EnvC (AmiA/AmiB activator)